MGRLMHYEKVETRLSSLRESRDVHRFDEFLVLSASDEFFVLTIGIWQIQSAAIFGFTVD
jgi:hypothetical protein